MTLAPTSAPDSLNMWGITAAFPDIVAESARRSAQWVAEAKLPPKERIEHIVVLGMGGSGIVGDVLVASASPYLSVPVLVVKSYEVPAFVSESSLVFAVSFSGDTEETVEAATEAQGAGARLVVVSGPGELLSFAQRAELPHFALSAEIPQPRAALGAMAVPPLFALEAMGLFPGASSWVEEAVGQLLRRREDCFSPDGVAAEIAAQIGTSIPLVESSRTLGAAAALRWKTQINENAKRPAFSSTYPELCHNEVVGWKGHPADSAGIFTVVNLRHDTEHPQVARRMELVAELAGDGLRAILEVHAQGEGELSQLLDLIMIGDAVSLFLAANDGIDPGPVAVLEELKARLRRG